MPLPKIEEWKYRAVRRRAQGESEYGCAMFAGVTPAVLQWGLQNDSKFRKDYEEAGENAPKKPR